MKFEYLKRLSLNEFLAIISSIGVMIWIISDFFGGMIIWLFSYGLIILPVVIIYIFSAFDTLFSLVRYGKKVSRIKLLSHIAVLMTVICFHFYHSELWRSEKVLSAILKDDLFYYQLVLRKNGKVENNVVGIFGYSKTYHGTYRIENDLLIFEKRPYDNDFIPDTLLIDKNQNALFLFKDSDGNFKTKKEWLNHFEIEKR